MDYNTNRGKLVMKEYGRYIQRIVQNCMQEKDRDRRNQFAKEIIELMGQLNPHLRNVEDFRHKLWDHLFIMSDYQLDVDSPYPIKKREEIEKKPGKLPYPQSKIKYKHYGKHVESLIDKAKNTEDPDKKKEFTNCIGNFMKLVYDNWSNEDINDDTIKNDLRMLSKGELNVSEGQDLGTLSRANRSREKSRENKNQKKGNGKNKNKKFFKKKK